jgi:prepilin-type N-terminal cleavage/methylation domain-containing protein
MKTHNSFTLRSFTLNGLTPNGFTLIELLVVMAIISALTAIMVPKYSEYRARAYDTRAQMDLRNVALAEEAYYLDNENYLSCTNQSCETLPGIATLSKGVELQIVAQTEAFTGNATHAQGSGKIFEWDSEKGGMIN